MIIDKNALISTFGSFFTQIELKLLAEYFKMNMNSYKPKIFVFFRNFCHKNVQIMPFGLKLAVKSISFGKIFNFTKVEF